MQRFFKPVFLVVTAVQWRAWFGFANTGGVQVAIVQLKGFKHFLWSEMLYVATAQVNAAAAIATQTALFFEQVGVKFSFLRILQVAVARLPIFICFETFTVSVTLAH